jgi:hypothetical protein
MNDILQDKLIILSEQLQEEYLRAEKLEQQNQRMQNFLMDLIVDIGAIFNDMTSGDITNGDKTKSKTQA